MSAVHDKTPLWRDVLSSATTSNASLDSKTLIVLGNTGVGKESLISSLRTKDDKVSPNEGGMAMEYTYMKFKLDEDDDGDQAQRFNVWKLSDTDHASLLKFAIKPQELSSTMVLIMTDFKEPWAMNKSFQTWLDILEKGVLAALDDCPDTSVEQESHNVLQKFLQSYVEPTSDTGSPKSQRVAASFSGGDDEVLLPLGEGMLTKNLGIPIVLVCNKADAINKFESECEYQDSDFDFIQQHLRQLALTYGATLIYTAPRGSETHSGVEILRDYISHRMFGSYFGVKAEVLEKDAVFVPAGYDSKEKISVLEDPSKVGDYEEVICAPDENVKKARDTEEIVAMADNDFLAQHQESLAQAATSERRSAKPLFAAMEESKLETPGAAAPSAAVNASAATLPSVAGSNPLNPNSSAMLQNFFESLMKSESNEGLRKGVEEIIGDEKKLQENSK
jgi:dynein light intermediate chain 1